jgi:hypothetical protein
MRFVDRQAPLGELSLLVSTFTHNECEGSAADAQHARLS